MDFMDWYLVISAAGIFGLLALLNAERWKRKQLETVVAMLRDKEPLSERGCELYMTARKYDFLGNELPA